MNERFSNMRDLNNSLAEALNMIDPNIEHHHQQTAYMAYMIARSAGFDEQQLALARMAALTHDIGFITMEDPQSVEEIETGAERLAELGANLIEGFPGGANTSKVVRYCQSRWAGFLALPESIREENYASARVASVVHLADVVSVLLKTDVPVLNQVKGIRETISAGRGTEFSEEAVDAFLRASENEFIWLDLRYNPDFLDYFVGEIEDVSLDRTVEMTVIISRIIDYRSSFTAMHSAGVSASAAALARLAGMSDDECKMMKIAGYMHDIGKLRVPRAILEKPRKLSEEEFNIIKEHPYYTRLNLMNVKGFERIANWAGFHHEKLDGSGYPFHFGADILDLGSRIMAIADIYSAITEVRPYRDGMERKDAMRILKEDADRGKLDKDLVALLDERYDEINEARKTASQIEGTRYFASINGKRA